MHELLNLLIPNELLFCYIIPYSYRELDLGHFYHMSCLFIWHLILNQLYKKLKLKGKNFKMSDDLTPLSPSWLFALLWGWTFLALSAHRGLQDPPSCHLQPKSIFNPCWSLSPPLKLGVEGTPPKLCWAPHVSLVSFFACLVYTSPFTPCAHRVQFPAAIPFTGFYTMSAQQSAHWKLCKKGVALAFHPKSECRNQLQFGLHRKCLPSVHWTIKFNHFQVPPLP